MHDFRHDSEALARRAREWERFARWEARAEATRKRSFEDDLAWLAAAIEMARAFDPEWGSLERVRLKAARHARVRAVLGAPGA